MSRLLAKLRLKIFVRLMLVYFALGLLSFVIFRWLLPDSYFDAYPAIGLFYWALGMFLNYSLSRARFNTPNRLAYVFMTFRIFKLLSTILVIAVSGFIAEEHKTAIVLSVIANYVIYMVVELYVYHMYNKRISIRNAAAKKRK